MSRINLKAPTGGVKSPGKNIMKQITLKDKIKLLNAATASDVERLREAFPGYKVGADPDGRVWVRKDLARATREAIWAEGVTQMALAERLGKSKQNLGGWINGKRDTLPVNCVEEILFLLDD